jgi:hypothetical protein
LTSGIETPGSPSASFRTGDSRPEVAAEPIGDRFILRLWTVELRLEAYVVSPWCGLDEPSVGRRKDRRRVPVANAGAGVASSPALPRAVRYCCEASVAPINYGPTRRVRAVRIRKLI